MRQAKKQKSGERPILVRPKRACTLPRSVQDHLGRDLQALYAQTLQQTPRHLALLLSRLERQLTRKPASQDFRNELLAAVPGLRAFAISLAGTTDRADDLVQETIMRALDHADRFQPGTNLAAWLATILRNSFHSDYRKRRREVEDVEGSHAATLKAIPAQLDHVHFQELQGALDKLSPAHRQALILIGAEGRSYEEAAEISGCSIGTIKSRVSRARARLADLMGLTADGLATDNLMHAALTAD